MDEKLKRKTDELIDELTKNRTDFETFIEENESSLIEVNLREFWGAIVKRSGMKSSDIINKSDLSYYYFYEVINGKKIPSKDKIVCLALAMHMTVDECQTALKYCGKAALYPKFKRDSVFIYAISHSLSLIETNALLDKEGLERL